MSITRPAELKRDVTIPSRGHASTIAAMDGWNWICDKEVMLIVRGPQLAAATVVNPDWPPAARIPTVRRHPVASQPVTTRVKANDGRPLIRAPGRIPVLASAHLPTMHRTGKTEHATIRIALMYVSETGPTRIAPSIRVRQIEQQQTLLRGDRPLRPMPTGQTCARRVTRIGLP